ncbi:MAG: BrnT family toxin [Deltaproteobacteria bacterium]|nr:BrnT family toxin [Deltaproteobacteria bacterium]
MDLKFCGFDWDEGNREKSLRKHQVNCQEAEEVFLGSPMVYVDERHSTEEEKRYVLFGKTNPGRTLLIAFTMREEKVRIISARPMSQKERKWYEEESRKTNP